MAHQQHSKRLTEKPYLHYKSGHEQFGNNQYKIELVSKASLRRREVELFMYTCYQKHFSAELKSFSPIILAIIDRSDQSIISALGLSYADETKLFSEAYIKTGIESLISQLEQKQINRSKIIELNSFVVDKTINVKKVLPQICNFIKSLNVDWSIYTLTKPMKRYFDRFGIQLNFLSKASAHSVSKDSDWGDYYSFDPSVYYSNVRQN